MDKNEIRNAEFKPFDVFDKSWALLCAGTIEDHNAMTISWGGMGTLWHRDVVTVYVKPIRHTYSYLEKNPYFTLSFFDEPYRGALSIMGSVSGRTHDKDKEAGLTPIKHHGTTIYEEAKITLICKKIYHNDLLLENIPLEEKRRYYEKEAPHRMYIGEVIEVVRK